MGYNNQGNEQKKDGYDKTKDVIVWKHGVQGNKRYLNVLVYSYNGGETKIRISPRAENTNPNQTDPSKKWINLSGISGITKAEAQGLAQALLDACKEF